MEGDGKVRYKDKLGKVGISIEDDPYLSNANFLSDMVAWPCVEYGHIFSYLITRPGVYTLEQLLSWKQLEGYNYFQSNYVRTVWLRRFGINKSSEMVNPLSAKTVSPGSIKSRNPLL